MQNTTLLNNHGNWVGIENIQSGRLSLFYSFHHTPLMVKKGKSQIYCSTYDREMGHESVVAIVYAQILLFNKIIAILIVAKYKNIFHHLKSKVVYGFSSIKEALNSLEILKLLEIEYSKLLWIIEVREILGEIPKLSLNKSLLKNRNNFSSIKKEYCYEYTR